MRILIDPLTRQDSGNAAILKALAAHEVVSFAPDYADITYDIAYTTFPDLLKTERWYNA